MLRVPITVENRVFRYDSDDLIGAVNRVCVREVCQHAWGTIPASRGTKCYAMYSAGRGLAFFGSAAPKNQRMHASGVPQMQIAADTIFNE